MVFSFVFTKAVIASSLSFLVLTVTKESLRKTKVKYFSEVIYIFLINESSKSLVSFCSSLCPTI